MKHRIDIAEGVFPQELGWQVIVDATFDVTANGSLVVKDRMSGALLFIYAPGTWDRVRSI